MPPVRRSGTMGSRSLSLRRHHRPNSGKPPGSPVPAPSKKARCLVFARDGPQCAYAQSPGWQIEPSSPSSRVNTLPCPSPSLKTYRDDDPFLWTANCFPSLPPRAAPAHELIEVCFASARVAPDRSNWNLNGPEPNRWISPCSVEETPPPASFPGPKVSRAPEPCGDKGPRVLPISVVPDGQLQPQPTVAQRPPVVGKQSRQSFRLTNKPRILLPT